MPKKPEKKKLKKFYVITGTDLEVHEVGNNNDLNEVFRQHGIDHEVLNGVNPAHITVYEDDAESTQATVFYGGKPMKLHTSTEFHLDYNDE
jgi:hypothetical protein